MGLETEVNLYGALAYLSLFLHFVIYARVKDIKRRRDTGHFASGLDHAHLRQQFSSLHERVRELEKSGDG